MRCISFGSYFNLALRVSAAESLEAENGSVQLINSSQACHWFNLPAFFEEVDRVLSSGGVLALSGYKRPQFFNCTKAAELNQHMDQVFILFSSAAKNLPLVNKYAKHDTVLPRRIA